ncbi:MAG: hypothetical protein Q4E86_03375 [Lachnospiraceae bacterium]|nr:hypothetical protein [Lachnospiraceae bacterium]
MFEASLAPMGEAAEDLKKIANEINTRLTELYGPSEVLRELTYMEEPLRRIKMMQQRLDEKSARTLKLKMALEQICQQYLHTENEIIDYCEEAAAASRRRETAGLSDVEWVNQWIRRQISIMVG